MMWRINENRRAKLVESLRQHALSQEGRDYLLAMRAAACRYRKHSEWLWRSLALSFSTVQTRGDRVWKNVEAKLPSIAFCKLTALPDEAARRQFLAEQLKGVGYRYPARFHGFLADAVTVLETAGGPAAVAARLESMSDADKIAFLAHFKGVSHKYARNIWMDVDPGALTSSFAIDSNIMYLIKALFDEVPAGVKSNGIPNTKRYQEAEAYLTNIARDAGLSTWEADRLMYRFRQSILFDMRAV